MSLEEDRLRWEKEATAVAMPEGVTSSREGICGVPCLWLQSEGGGERRPLVLYLHGGGLVSGSILTHRNFVASLVLATGSDALVVDYRLLPENPFPAPIDDVASVYRWLLEEGGYRPSELFLGGDSSGGGLVLSALTRLRDKGVRLPAGFFSFSGAFDMSLSGDSMKADPGKEPFLRLEDLKEWRDTYFEDVRSPELSPLRAELSGLPRSLILVGSDELWLSDSVRIHERLTMAGNESRIIVWDSMTHVWVMDTDLDESREALKAVGDFIGER